MSNELQPYKFDLLEFTNIEALELLRQVIVQYKFDKKLLLVIVIGQCIENLRNKEPMMIDSNSPFRYVRFFPEGSEESKKTVQVGDSTEESVRQAALIYYQEKLGEYQQLLAAANQDEKEFYQKMMNHYQWLIRELDEEALAHTSSLLTRVAPAKEVGKPVTTNASTPNLGTTKQLEPL